jgi:putative ABC transport system permease protein
MSGMGRRIYRLLALAYPAPFRRRYEAELLAAFEIARGEPRYARRGGKLLFWADILVDLVASAARQRARQLTAIVSHRRPDNRLPASGKVDMMLYDLRHALRLVVRQPAFSTAAVVSLALGIGGSSLVYGLVDGLVLHPFPYPDPDRLVSVGVTFPRQSAETTFIETISPAEYGDFKSIRSFVRTTAFDLGNRNVSGGDEPERLFTALLLDDPFEVIGMRPVAGRGFLPEELAPNGPRVAIISHRIWQSRFSGDPQIVGRAIRIGGQAATVVGVMPPGLLLLGTDLWIPWGGDPATMPRNVRQFTVLARLRPGSTLADANAELAATAGRVDQQYRAQFREYEGWRAEAQPWAAAVTGSLRDAAFVLFGAVMFVLFIACANVGNLLLARAASNQREVAVRLALGAARWRVARELLAESLLLSIAGAAGGLLLAAAGLAVAPRFLPAQVLSMDPDIALNGRVLAFGIALAIVSTVVIGLIPIVRAWRTSRREWLSTEGRRATGGRAVVRLRHAFIVAEVALAVALLTGAGLLARSFMRVQAIDLGFDPSRVLTMRLTLPREKYQGEAIHRFFNAVLERVRAIPDVERASAASQYPPMGAFDTAFEIEGQESGETHPNALITVMSPEHFATLGVPLKAGRGFDTRDRLGAPPVASVNRTFADRYLRGAPPIGRRIRIGPARPGREWVEVVSVVADMRNRGATSEAAPEIFMAMDQQVFWNQLFLMVRARGDAAALLPAVRREILVLDPEQPVYAISTLEGSLRAALFPQRVSFALIGLFAVVALVLAAVGVYGVMAHAVVARTHEIGIRMALGAGRGTVVRMILRQAMVLVVFGLLIGLGLALAAGRALSTLLVDVTPRDPVTLATVSMLLAAVGAAAGYLPARRAVRIEPSESLRYE